jgi:hypothetical protein
MVEPSNRRDKTNSRFHKSSNDVIKIEFKGKTYTCPTILQNRFYIDRRIDGGAFGAIFDCLDKPMMEICVIKIVSINSNIFVVDACKIIV